MKIKILALSAIMASVFYSCYYDVEQELYPTNSTSCDTSNITYSVTIKGILLNNACMGCHNQTVFASSGGNVNLDGYSNVKSYIDNGKLLSSIVQDGKASFMPKGGAKMGACSLLKVQTWINAGAPNN
ncbi:MAG: hypothetical protein H6607_07865 [Flavobacteriales bacterium]|nr:hypothetical protein [Flavobacteriales bacterium]